MCSAPIGEADVVWQLMLLSFERGSVSLVGSDVKTPLKILRIRGPTTLTLLVLCCRFQGNTDTGDFVLSRGMGLSVFPAPLHKMVLDCELVQGEVDVGVAIGIAY